MLDNLLRSHFNTSHTTDRPSNSTSVGSNVSGLFGFDIHEPDNLAFIYSLQLATFLFAVCDHVILVLDHLSLDAYLLKLISTALVMVGESTPKANLIVYNRCDALERTQSRRLEDFDYAASSKMGRMFMDNNCNSSIIVDKMVMQQYQKQYQETLQTIIGPAVNIDFINDEVRLVKTVLTPPSRQLIGEGLVINYSSEKAWLQSVHKYWQGSIKKTTLFSDYARCLP